VQRVETRRDGTKPGQILAQAPAAGSKLAEGQRLTLTVSLGNTLVGVPPKLVGARLADANATLAKAGLATGKVSHRYDEKAAKDVVLAVTGDAAGQARMPKGAKVDLRVSDGPAPRPVPSLTGLTYAQAASKLRALGLVPAKTTKSSRQVAEGVVMGTSPPASEKVPKGGTVTVVVSSGPPLVAMPDVTGMSADAATRAIEAKGLSVGGVSGPPTMPVLSTDPPAGALVREGSEVTLVTKRG
jgi:serine/threonine-protein kinase